MRRVIVTDKNKEAFLGGGDDAVSVLETVDELLHDKGFELIVGDNGSSDYSLRIDPIRVDKEYDKERTHTVLYGRGKGMFDRFEI